MENTTVWLRQLQERTDRATRTFGSLTAAQLNWKPGPEQWSIGQCLHHLIVSNKTYFPALQRMAAGTHRNPMMAAVPGVAAFWGRMLKSSVHPDSRKKLKRPAVFAPASSEVPADVVQQFVQHQAQLAELLQAAAAQADPLKTVLASPAAPVIIYTLADCIEMLTLHEARHLNQADRVLQQPGFPH